MLRAIFTALSLSFHSFTKITCGKYCPELEPDADSSASFATSTKEGLKPLSSDERKTWGFYSGWQKQL